MGSTNSELSNVVKTQEQKMDKGAATQGSDGPNFNDYIINKDAISKGAEAAKSGVEAGAKVLQGDFSKGGKNLSDEEMQKVLDGMGQKHGLDKIIEGIDKKHFYNPEVSDKDRKEAQEKMDKELSGLIPEADRKAIGDLTSAVLSGDKEKLAKTVQELGKDPAKLDAYIKEMNKNLEKNGSDTRMAVNKDGKVVVYGSGDQGVEVDPKTGKTSVFRVERDFKGNVTQGGEVLNGNVGKALKNIGDDTTRDINGDSINRIIGGGIGKPGFDPERPFKPFDPIDPIKPFEPKPKFPHWEPTPLVPKGGWNLEDEPMIKRPRISEFEGRTDWMMKNLKNGTDQ